MGNPNLKNKKNLSLALMLMGVLLCVLPPLMIGGVSRYGLGHEIFCLIREAESSLRCQWGSVRVRHLIGVGVALIACGVFVRFSKEG